MTRLIWMRRHRTVVAAVALGLALLVAVGLGIWFGWDWKALIGWKALVHYINPKDATGRKDAVQVYAVIVAGVVATITAAVGLLNLRLTRRNLEQQRELEAQRAQGTALQAYYEQIGKLLIDKDLLNTQQKEIRELARGQTLTVLQGVDGKGKRSLLTFLHGAGLIGAENPAVALNGADLQGADLRGAVLEEANLEFADLQGADLQKANLQRSILEFAEFQGADLRGAILLKVNLGDANLQRAELRGAVLLQANLQDANLQGANLQGANLQAADLQGANLQGAFLMEANLQDANLQRANLLGSKVAYQQLDVTLSLQGATMPDR